MTSKNAKILIVEDERIVADDIKMSVERLGYAISGKASSGKEAIKKAGENNVNLVLMDIILDGKMDGIEAASIIRSRFDIPVVYLTNHADDKTIKRAKISEPFGYILKPVEGRNLHTSIEMALQKRKLENMLREKEEKLQKTLENTIKALSSTVEIRDPYTAGHQERVTELACGIAVEIGLSTEQIEGIRLAGMIHDIGKIRIPPEILSKPGQLTKIDFNMIKIHPQVGFDILKTIEFPYPVAHIVLQHHERMDGSGYPLGLKGDKILPEARVLAVADTVEAIASHRPYRAALGLDRALKEISEQKGLLYDTEVVDACVKLFKEKGFKFNGKTIKNN